VHSVSAKIVYTTQTEQQTTATNAKLLYCYQ